jgi:hypothetical protein
MREICKSGSMRGSGRPASNAPTTLYSTGRMPGLILPGSAVWASPDPIFWGGVGLLGLLHFGPRLSDPFPSFRQP